MSVTRTCDLCGREITEKEPYVVVQITGDNTSKGFWGDGWLTHLHSRKKHGGRGECFERFDDLVLLLRERAEHIGAIPVADESEIQALRDQHHNPARDSASESLRGLGLTPRAQRGLVRRGVDLAAAAGMADEELLAIDGVGHGSLRHLREASKGSEAGR